MLALNPQAAASETPEKVCIVSFFILCLLGFTVSFCLLYCLLRGVSFFFFGLLLSSVSFCLLFYMLAKCLLSILSSGLKRLLLSLPFCLHCLFCLSLFIIFLSPFHCLSPCVCLSPLLCLSVSVLSLSPLLVCVAVVCLSSPFALQNNERDKKLLRQIQAAVQQRDSCCCRCCSCCCCSRCCCSSSGLICCLYVCRCVHASVSFFSSLSFSLQTCTRLAIDMRLESSKETAAAAEKQHWICSKERPFLPTHMQYVLFAVS